MKKMSAAISAILLVAILCLYLIMDQYADKKTRRLPPKNTPRGKQARKVTGAAVLFTFVALIISTASAGSASEIRFAIFEVAMGIVIAFAFALARMGGLGRK